MNVERKTCGGGREYASQTQANVNSWLAGLAAVLGIANSGGCGNGNILNRLFGGNGGNGCGNGGFDVAAMLAMLNAGNNCGGGGPAVNRYEAQQSARIAELETEVKLRDANTFTMQEMGKLRDYMETKFDKVDERLCKQAEWNAAQTGALSCMQSQIQQLFGLTKLVVPNTSVCPGWGNVTITPAAATTAAGAAA